MIAAAVIIAVVVQESSLLTSRAPLGNLADAQTCTQPPMGLWTAGT